MNAAMLPVVLQLLPLLGALVLGSLYVPYVQGLLNPGNAISIASDQTFQADTFSLDGSLGSLLLASTESNATSRPDIVTGRWSLDIEAASVTLQRILPS